MKQKCLTMVKVMTALVLAVLMMVGSVSNVVGAVIGTASFDGGSVLVASAEKGLEIAENANSSEEADADAPDLSAFEENEIVRGMKDDLAGTGWNSSTDRLHLRVGSTWTDYYFNSSGVTTFTIANDNTTIEFELNFNGTVYKLHSSQQGFSAAGIHSENGEERLAKSDGSSTYSFSGVYADT